MTTLHDAKRIVELFASLESLNARLASIEETRQQGTTISVEFQIKNKQGSWGDMAGVKYSTRFQSAGNLSDIAAIVLARLSDDVAHKKRKVERELRDLGATMPIGVKP